VKTVDKRGLALLLPRGIDNFPDRKSRLSGTIDVWWVARWRHAHPARLPPQTTQSLARLPHSHLHRRAYPIC